VIKRIKKSKKVTGQIFLDLEFLKREEGQSNKEYRCLL
jgi:hypothetical protein